VPLTDGRNYLEASDTSFYPGAEALTIVVRSVEKNSNLIQSGKSVGMGLAVSDSGATTRMLARNAVRSSSLC
jgi:hypothetical protein